MQLTGLDAAFLYFETDRTPMHVAGLTLYELPEGFTGSFHEHFTEFFKSRVHLIPVFNKKLARTIFQLDHPGWVDAGPLDFDYHITGEHLGAHNTDAAVEARVAQLHAEPLDRKKPLWKFVVIEGLSDGPNGEKRAALYSKVHHAAIDGGAGMVITQALYDLGPKPRDVEPPKPVKESRKPSVAERAVLGMHDVVSNVVTQQFKAMEAIPKAMGAALDGVERLTAAGASKPLARLAEGLGAPRTPFSITMGKGRTYAARTLSLMDAIKLSKATGTKLNDVVMAICAGALRHYLEGKGQLPDKPLVAFVPISTREKDNKDLNNQVASMNVPLATQIADPLHRLKRIAKASSARKDVVGSVKDLVPTDYTFLGAPHLLSGLMRAYGDTQLADLLPQSVNLCISNTAGPPFPMYCAGAKVLAIYPVSIVTHGIGLNITVQTYMADLNFGIVGGRRAMPDMDVFADLIAVSFAELQEAVAKEQGEVAEPTPDKKPDSAPKTKPAAKAKLASKPKAKKEPPKAG